MMTRLLITFITLYCIACSSHNSSNELLLVESMDTTKAALEKIPDKMIGDIIECIPSPIETSNIIKQCGGVYNLSILNPVENYKQNYVSNFDKAINLGIYGTDLGYINIYSQSNDALAYLGCIQGLADELKIGQFFDYHTIRRLAESSNNTDSLLYHTTANFEKMNHFLYSQKRAEHSALILTGGWLEALYLSCHIASTNNSQELYERIGDQKVVLDQLLILLAHYHHDIRIKELSDNLLELQKAFNKINVSVDHKEEDVMEVNGVLVFNDHSESHSSITEMDIKEIGKLATSLRQKITS